MIPEFPQFKKIELSDKEDVEKFTKKFLPYSDFNFTNIWSWDLVEDMGFSILNNNLIVKFSDYVNGQPFFSFLGDNMVNETVKELIDFSEKNYKNDTLKLIPETVVDLIDKTKFEIISDIGSHDYVYLISRLAAMNTWTQNSFGKRIRQFLKKYPDYIVKESSICEIKKEEYIQMFKKWAENKSITNFFDLNEYKAFEKLLQINDKNLKVISLYVKDTLIGFTVAEIGAGDYVISHFAKADTSYHSSVYDVLNWEESKILETEGIKYYNWEQDLGIKGLKSSKLKYKPDFFLNKFFVRNLS